MRRTTHTNKGFDAQAKMCVKFIAQSTFLSISFREYLKSNNINQEAAISIFFIKKSATNRKGES